MKIFLFYEKIQTNFYIIYRLKGDGFMGLVQGHGVNDMPWGWASENEWNRMVYQKWRDMLRRCYDEEFHKTKNGKCYIGCTVCEQWLTLSNFVNDVPKITGYDEERLLNGELHLDKDKKKDENKHYIMKYCTWLPGPENCALAWEEKFGSDNPMSKRVAQYDKQTLELIKIWGGMREVERELGINQGNISQCCKGKLKSAGGFIWKYIEDE